MAYRFLDHLTRADVAFEVNALSIEEFFRSAAEAVVRTMVDDPSTIRQTEMREFHAEVRASSLEEGLDHLLYDVLQKLVFYKDAEQLLLLPKNIRFLVAAPNYEFRAELWGEVIDPERHEMIVDVKAVTMHQFHVKHSRGEWHAQVVLDV